MMVTEAGDRQVQPRCQDNPHREEDWADQLVPDLQGTINMPRG
jgi:hypothetical protein